MSEERIFLPARRRKDVREFQKSLADLGFTKLSYAGGILVAEKVSGQNLDGKPFLDLRIELKTDSIGIIYIIPPNRGKMARLLEVLPILLNTLTLAEEYYDVRASAVFPTVNAVLGEVSKVLDKDSVEFAAQVHDFRNRYENLKVKYDDLVRSSEANTRILLEIEQKNEELEKRISTLSGMGDEVLRETLYEWIRIHCGNIDIREFTKANGVALARVKEGLNSLIRDGYIRRRPE